jgi:hypothetical protein
MVPWRVLRLVIADSQHFDEEQDPNPHQSKKSDPDLHRNEKRNPDPHPGNLRSVKLTRG